MTAPTTHYDGSAGSSGETVILNVPFRSQYDGSPYQYANCGPASLGMVLAAYGVNVPNEQLRAIADQLQGTSGYDDGVALDSLDAIARQAGLKAEGLLTADNHYRRWSMGDLILAVRHGYPVITLVHYASLPGHAGSPSKSDHYVVVVGVTSQGFVINDPAYSGSDGYQLLLRPDQLLVAWHDAEIQNQASAFLPPSGHLALMGALDAPNGALRTPSASTAPSAAGPPAPALQAAPVAPAPVAQAPGQSPALPGSLAATTEPFQPSPTPTVSLATQAWQSALSGWNHLAPVATIQPVRADSTSAADSTLVLGEDGNSAPSPLPSLAVVVLVGAIGLAILKAPRRDEP